MSLDVSRHSLADEGLDLRDHLVEREVRRVHLDGIRRPKRVVRVPFVAPPQLVGQHALVDAVALGGATTRWRAPRRASGADATTQRSTPR